MNLTNSTTADAVASLTIGVGTNQLEMDRLAFIHERKAFDAVGEVIDITADIFGTPIAIKRNADPEALDEIYTCFCVTAPGSAQDIIALENESAHELQKFSLNGTASAFQFGPQHEA